MIITAQCRELVATTPTRTQCSGHGGVVQTFIDFPTMLFILVSLGLLPERISKGPKLSSLHTELAHACWLPSTHMASHPDPAHTVTCKCHSTRDRTQPRDSKGSKYGPKANQQQREAWSAFRVWLLPELQT